MLKNTTLNLPDTLLARTKSYAAAHGTTMTALIRAHLEAITAPDADLREEDALLAYSQGLLSRRDALERLGLRDSAALVVALGEADLPPPYPPPHVIENQATTFAKIWRSS